MFCQMVCNSIFGIVFVFTVLIVRLQITYCPLRPTLLRQTVCCVPTFFFVIVYTPITLFFPVPF